MQESFASAWYPPSTIFVTALTTPFSPAADCFGSTYSIADGSNDTTDSTVIGTPGITFSTLRHGYTSSCYPEGGLSAIFEPPYYGGWFEPGYCPNGFTTVSAKITNGATTAVCCPSYECAPHTYTEHALTKVLGLGAWTQFSAANEFTVPAPEAQLSA
ncbi:uncharacterized protein RHO25_003488 [Cercospora beticola]|uniref:Uncharacterized protein n=1 Tax=Cercospora beticola TaxID=122368 RepID=A0ABZ0NH67_CERBT|nr:hypothetical protein RHO25_003488 [Cercospora beticola]